jgi:tetratricopeptide (TPR) repeat protein
VLEGLARAGAPGAQLSYTMDSLAAVAMGAAMCCLRLLEPQLGAVRRPALDSLARVAVHDIAGQLAAIPEEQGEPGPAARMGGDELAAARHAEAELRRMDLRAAALHEAKNALESRIFETRGLLEGRKPFAELITDRDAIGAALDAADSWLYEFEPQPGASAAPLEALRARLAELDDALAPLLAPYRAKLEAERSKTEAALESEAAAAAAELAAAGGKDDLDSRKLPKAERMRKVDMNKQEGNSLFKDGNIEAASLRYIRALQHCDKFFDLGPQDEREVDALKLSLHLNLAQCHLKLSAWKECAKSANAALAIDANSSKALYRLAFAQENLKEFDEAKANLLKAAALEPNDTAIPKLLERVNAQLKREQDKRKAMAKKMFG